MDKEDAHFCLRCRSTIIGLDEYVAHRKSEVCVQQQDQQQQPSLYIPQGQDDDDRFSSTHFSTTAADALASEAAFMESIGLCLNPKPSLQLARVPGLMSPRSTLTTSKPYPDERESASRDDWDDVFTNKSKTNFAASPIPDLETSGVGSKSDFLKQIDLMTVDQNQPGPSGSNTPRWRLWHPEHETGDDLWSEMLSTSENDLYLETVANDPTLMEMSVSMLAASTPQNVFKSKGKWLSPSDDISCLLDKSNEDVAKKSPPYFCKTCDRSLSSGDAYSRHLSSELHFKRSSAVATLEEPEATPKKRTKKLSPGEVIGKVMTDELAEMTKRARKKILTSGHLISCPTCLSKVNRDQFGKHLISHYHHHKSMGHPDNKNLALNYIEEIVLEAPFNCKICNFYCNWNSDFVDHWSGSHHRSCDETAADNEATTDSVYWCSFCRYQCQSSDRMLQHLRGEDHSEIVDVINRSVPIVIRRCQLQACHVCSKTFRLKFSLRAHVRSSHKQKKFQLPGHERHSCRFCGDFKTFSEKSLRSHEFLAHPEERPKRGYECRFCFLNFKSKVEAERHRKTLSHRTNVKLSKGISTVVKCQFCDEKVDDLSRLKDHILEKHKDEASQCGFCGARFALPQDLSVHVKSKCRQIVGEEQRRKDVTSVDNNAGVEKCDIYGCQFSCASKAMMILHQSVKHSSAPVSSYTCIVCDKICFTRSKLLEHVRIHIKSSMQKCKFCYKLFESGSQLQSHVNKVHRTLTDQMTPATTEKDLDSIETIYFSGSCHTIFEDRKSMTDHKRSCRRVFRCPNCHFSARSNAQLEQHQVGHCDADNVNVNDVTEKRFSCDECSTFTCDRSSELARHRRLKHGVREKPVLQCCHCDYATVFKQHLDRHIGVVHPLFTTGLAASVFFCPGCDYSCNALDNLRKHILSTKKHSGMSVYHCKVSSCQYSTNESQEFKRHLSTDHCNVFRSDSDVKAHLDNFFKTKCKRFYEATSYKTEKTSKKKSEESRPQQRRKQLLCQRTCDI